MIADNEKIVIWGTGNIAKSFYYGKCYRYDVQYFIDNYEPKYEMRDLKVYHPQEVNLKKYKIIIAIAEWKSVARQLEEKGLSFHKDYLPYEFINKDEIPIMDILERITDWERREAVIQEYQCGRKIVWINGNCQTGVIKQFLKQNKEFSKEYVFWDMPEIYLMSQNEVELLMQNCDIMKEINLFISQNISLRNSFDYRLSNEYLINLMSENIQYIRIPNLFFDIYFPEGGKEQDPTREEYVRYFFPYNDAVIDELVGKKGFDGERYTTDEIVQIITLENFFSNKFFAWVIQYRIKQLKDRESTCDIKMMDYIESNYMEEYLFYSRNHPTNKVLKEESVRILQYINPKWSTTIEREETIHPLSNWQEFIYPSFFHQVKPAFTKKWYSDGISPECKYTIEEEIKKYLFCCHNQ